MSGCYWVWDFGGKMIFFLKLENHSGDGYSAMGMLKPLSCTLCKDEFYVVSH